MTEDEYLKKLCGADYSEYEDYGSEDQNTLMNLIKNYKGDYENMDEQFVEKVSTLIGEIEGYEQVISDATSAMTSAELELSEVLTENEENIQ